MTLAGSVCAGDLASTPDLVDRDFTATEPASKLVGDITYIPTWEGWLYLATVLDCYSKKVVGYAMADHMRTELVTDALSMASRNLDFIEDVTIFHSDRGCQYMSIYFGKVCGVHGWFEGSPFAGSNRYLLRQCVGGVVQWHVEERAGESHGVPDKRARTY